MPFFFLLSSSVCSHMHTVMREPSWVLFDRSGQRHRKRNERKGEKKNEANKQQKKKVERTSGFRRSRLFDSYAARNFEQLQFWYKNGMTALFFFYVECILNCTNQRRVFEKSDSTEIALPKLQHWALTWAAAYTPSLTMQAEGKNWEKRERGTLFNYSLFTIETSWRM